MNINLADYKTGKTISKLLYEEKQAIQDLASVIGSLFDNFPVLPYGKPYYRELERCKIYSLKLKERKI